VLYIFRRRTENPPEPFNGFGCEFRPFEVVVGEFDYAAF
jgi:hypothetical protein